MTSLDLQECIQCGVELLDACVPDWRSKINLQDLKMDDCKLCILGQLFKDYDEGLLQLVPDDDEDSDQWSIEHGFQSDCYVGKTYADLDEAWKKVLTQS